jgi:release factor glutamine methyltransferase
VSDPSLRLLLREATGILASAGVPSPEHDARELAAHALGIRPADLVTRDTCTPAEAVAFDALVSRRAARVPLQHLTGESHFRRVTLAVGPGVFIPRPETEVVVEAALVEVRRLVAGGHRRPVVVDLCTGSGAMAASVALEAPEARVHAVELAPDAFAWAERNLAASDVDLRLGDAASAFPDLDGQVDVVVTNPPYIPADGLIRDPEVLEHDPPLALWGGGPDGLDVPRSVIARAHSLLRPGGLLVIEHADVQGAAMVDLLTAAGWVEVADHRDLAGRDRYATARPGRMTA